MNQATDPLEQSVQEFLKECRQAKDTFWAQTPRYVNNYTPSSMESAEPERVLRLETRLNSLDSRLRYLESMFQTAGSVGHETSTEDKLKMMRLLTKAETLVHNLTLSNQKLRSQLGSAPVQGFTEVHFGSPKSPEHKGIPSSMSAQLPEQQPNDFAGDISKRRFHSAPAWNPMKTGPPAPLPTSSSGSSSASIPRVNTQNHMSPGKMRMKITTPKSPPAISLTTPPVASTASTSSTSSSSASTTFAPSSSSSTSSSTSSSSTTTAPTTTTITSSPQSPTHPSSPQGLSPSDSPPNSRSQQKMSVQYPRGYDPQKRRFSVSSESFNPDQFQQKKIIPKSEKAKARIRDIVRGNVLFKHLDDDQLGEVVDCMDEITVEAGVTVIKQGAFVDENNMYVVDAGELDVLYGEDIVATLSSGNAFGEIALMYGCPRTATIKTKTSCKLWVLDRNSFRRILMEESIRRRKLYESVLTKVPIFKSLLPYERSKIADALESVTFKENEVIIKEGSTDTDKFYIVERGEVVCSKASQDGLSQVESSRLKAGDFFGERALLTNEPRKATVTAVGNVKCLTIGREHFNQVMGPCEEILRRNIVNYKTYEQLVNEGKRIDGEKERLTTAMEEDEDDFGGEEDIKIDDLPSEREEVIKYIIANEYNYFYNLLQTEGYLKAIQAHKQQLQISDSQIQKIFSNILEILAVHGKFNEVAKTIKEEDDPEIGGMLNNLASSLTCYETYTKNYAAAIQTLLECKHTAFADFLMACRKEAGEALDTLLEIPVLRVNYLQEMATHLFDATEINHPDKNELALTVRKLESAANSLKDLRKASKKS